MNRRDFLKISALTGVCLSIPQLLFANREFSCEIKSLLEGNERYLRNLSKPKETSDEKRAELASGQQPFAVVVSCSDSRVGPEIIFDKDLGEIFVIRTAGNVVDKITLGSIEYAVEHLHSSIVVVVGHEGCGAVKAAIELKGKPEGNIGAIVEKIIPAVKTAKRETDAYGGNLLYNAVKQNIKNVTQEIPAKSHIIAHALKEGHINVLGAYYSISTGKVERI
ncbi:MAG: carbonic anhydrase [Nitrospirae bacterium]|nr:carbonic anhydrase [Nitrospirota bacterium]